MNIGVLSGTKSVIGAAMFASENILLQYLKENFISCKLNVRIILRVLKMAVLHNKWQRRRGETNTAVNLAISLGRLGNVFCSLMQILG